MLAQRDSGGVRLFPDVTASAGTIYGVPLLVSSGSPGILALVDGDAVLVVDEGIAIDSSKVASLEFDTAPVGGAGATVSSLWQTNAIGMRFQRYIAWSLAWSDGAAFIDLAGV